MERNNKSDRKLIFELQKQLVQTCLNFINENKLGDVGAISFSADALQESANKGSWQPCTDSVCEFFDLKGNSIDYSA